MYGVPQRSAVIRDQQQSTLLQESHSVPSEKEVQGPHPLAGNSSNNSAVLSTERNPRIALLTPYTGGNFGDASIQDAFIANIRSRLPRAQFSGISLNCDNFLERHGTQAYPLCNFNSPYYGMAYSAGSQRDPGMHTGARSSRASGLKSLVRSALSWIPGVLPLSRKLSLRFRSAKKEIQHWIGGYHFLRKQDLLVVSGGGQLDEEWGGPWGHPFTLLKWALLSRTARIPFAVVSVGVGKIGSFKCRCFLSTALRLAKYRSYRDKHSRELSGRLLLDSLHDSVVPDLAFSFPLSDLTPSENLRSLAKGKTIVAISPISYAKPESWPLRDRSLYDRYLRHIAEIVRLLSSSGYFVVVVWSSNSDRQAVSDLRQLFEVPGDQTTPFYSPALQSWKELVAILLSADILVASRLHSVILGALSQKPTIAISFDPKVDWVMEDLNQTDYLTQIRDFTPVEVAQMVQRIQTHRNDIEHELATYRQQIQPVLAKQYDSLAEMSIAELRNRN
jgi:polysaccharide pyruvyl transferase WcaK-like protein